MLTKGKVAMDIHLLKIFSKLKVVMVWVVIVGTL